jgi:hypothetical protein
MMRPGIDYGVRVLNAFGNFRVGQRFYPPALYRDKLVQCGFVERVKAPAEEPSCDETQSDDGLFTRGRRKQGRK